MALVAVVVLLLSLAFLIFFDPLFHYLMARQAQNLNGTLVAGRAGLSWRGFKVKDVKLTPHQGGPVLEVDRVEVELHPWRTIRTGHWAEAVGNITLDGVQLKLEVDDRGVLNLMTLLPQPKKDSLGFLNAYTGTVAVRQGWISYRDHRESGFLYALKDCEGSVAFAPGAPLALDFAAVPDQPGAGKLEIEGTVALARPDVRLAARVQNLELGPVGQHFTLRRAALVQGGTMSGDLRVDGSGDTWPELGRQLAVSGKLQLAGVAGRHRDLPLTLENLQGELQLVGGGVRTKGLVGQVDSTKFELSGSVLLVPLPWADLLLRVRELDLARLRQHLRPPPEMAGVVDLDVHLEGNPANPGITGTAHSRSLTLKGQELRNLSARFDVDRSALHLEELQAEAGGGTLAGEGWVFLSEGRRMILRLRGENAAVAGLFPQLSGSADFELAAVGSASDPLVYGHGRVADVSNQGFKVDEAAGNLLYDAGDLWLWGGEARAQGTDLRLPWAHYSTRDRSVEASVAVDNLAVPPVRLGKADITGTVSADARVWGSVDRWKELEVVGHVRDADLTAGPRLSLFDLAGSFAVSQGQVMVPWIEGAGEGGRVGMTGTISADRKRFDLYFSADDVAMAALQTNPWFTMPHFLRGSGDAVASWGTMRPGYSAFSVAVDSPSGEVFAAGQDEDHQLGWVAWGTGLDARGFGLPGELTGIVAGRQSPGSPLALTYEGTLSGSNVTALGQATIYDGQLDLTRNYVSWNNPAPPGGALGYSLRGSAFPFFGPVLAQPLERVVPIGDEWRAAQAGLDRWGQLSLNGGVNLRTGRLDVGFSTFGVDLNWLRGQLETVAGRPLLHPVGGIEVRGGLLSGSGRVSGTRAAPNFAVDFRAPWLEFGRVDSPQSVRLAAAGRLKGHGRELETDGLWISAIPYDSRLSRGLPREVGLSLARLAGRLNLAGPTQANLRLSTGGFPVKALTALLPPQLAGFMPYGNLFTRDLRIWGPTDVPSLAGQLALRQGGLWLKGEPMPIQQAVADFTSSNGNLKIDQLTMDSGPVHLEGSGTRTRDGSLRADMWAANVPLDYFHPLGTPWSGLTGEADLALSLRSRGKQPLTAYLGLHTGSLTWDPRVLGEQGTPFTLEDLTFGRVSNVDGKIQTGPGEGVQLRLVGGRVEVDIPENAVTLARGDGRVAAQGSVSVGSAPPRDASLADWFASAKGPDFKSFVLSFDKLTLTDIARVLGVSPGLTTALTSGKLALDGQWFRDHVIGSKSNLPRYELTLNQLDVEGGAEGQRSGFHLEAPSGVGYERQGGFGLAHLDPLKLAFFGPGTPAPGASPGTAVVNTLGELTGQGQMIVTQSGRSVNPPESKLELQATNLPLANLGFLKPGTPLAGTLQNFKLTLSGLLPRPKLELTAQTDAGQIGAFRWGQGTAGIFGDTGADGRYRVALDPGIDFFFGVQSRPEHSLSVKGDVALDWTHPPRPSNDRLELVWKGWSLAPTSSVNVTASLMDQDLMIADALLGGGGKSGGLMQGNLQLTGTLEEPELAGSLAIENGRLQSPWLGSVSGLNALARFEKIPADQAEPSPIGKSLVDEFLSRYTLERFEGRLGDQPFTASGKVELAGLEPNFLDVHFQGERLPVKYEDIFSGSLDVSLDLKGQPSRLENGQLTLAPVLEGSVNMLEGDLNFPVTGFDATRNLSQSLKGPIRYDIDLGLGDDFWVSFLNSSVRAQGNLKVLPSATTGNPVLAGEAFLSRGNIRIPFYELNFRVRQGWAYFDQDLMPTLENVEADTELGSYQISARVDGKYPDLRVNLVSNPPLAQASLQRLVAFGGQPGGAGYTGPYSGMLNENVGGLTPQFNTTSLLTGLVTTPITQNLGRLVGLSEVTFDFLPPYQYVLRLAKAIDQYERFLLTFTQITRASNFNEYLYGVEYRFSPQPYLTRLSVNNYGQPNLWFQGFFDFDI